MTPSSTHLVVIPSYNPGARLADTVAEALMRWRPVWVVDDGSTDASLRLLEARVGGEAGFRLIRRGSNGGKGAAVLTAARIAIAEGFTHALVMDADGQHTSERIADFMGLSCEHASSLIAGQPLFGPEAPKLRLYGRQLSVAMVWLELGGSVLRDPLFGFRVYPLAALASAMDRTRWARRYDFDPEVAVRMAWAGTPVVNAPATCRYIAQEHGGVSHFHYIRDNLRMITLHTRLMTERILRRRSARS